MRSSRQQVHLIDSHCHLDLEQFDADRSAVIAQARAQGVDLIINPGIDLQHSRQAVALAEAHPGIYAAVGVHPNSSHDFTPETLEELRTLCDHPKVVAVGEIGLDYHWETVTPKVQKQAFVAQLGLAAEAGLPVIIHSRESNKDVSTILHAWVHREEFIHSKLAQRPYTGVLHAYSGDLAMAREAYEWGFVLSLGGPVTYKNARQLHELTPQLRLDRLMLETDAPFLTPHPHRGTRNEPAHIGLIRDKLAMLYDLTPEKVAVITTQVAIRFFGLENSYYAGIAAPPQNLCV